MSTCSVESYTNFIVEDESNRDKTLAEIAEDYRNSMSSSLYDTEDVVRAILDYANNPHPAYKMLWDCGHTIDADDCDSYEEALNAANETMCMWQVEMIEEWGDEPTQEQKDEWDMFFENEAYIGILEYSAEDRCYHEVDGPSFDIPLFYENPNWYSDAFGIHN